MSAQPAVAPSAEPAALPEGTDLVEWYYEKGYSDGLPVVPPTPQKLAAMLEALGGEPQKVECRVPPRWGALTREVLAVNMVMAGCTPAYAPVVRAALLALCDPAFNLNGVQATTHMASPLLVVNGPIANEIGMNGGCNAFGSGNRANATIGRALQLVVRNVGGGRPQEIDRSILGNPGKYTFCFAEDETDPDWVPLNVARGHAPGTSTVTLFHGDGVQGLCDQKSRDPVSLARSFAMGLWSVCHPKLAQWSHAILVLSPDHHDIFRQAGWDRAKIEAGLWDALKRPGRDLVEGAGGVGEGIDPSRAGEIVDKFHPGGLLVVRAGARGGLFSAIIGGWTAQRRNKEVQVVSREIGT